MTRPIDETWRMRNSVACTEDIYCTEVRDYVLRTDNAAGTVGYAADAARARLAAQSPAMARLLARAISEAETDAILVPNGPTVCEWDAQARAVLRAAGVVE